MKSTLNLLLQESGKTDFQLSKFLLHFGSLLMFDLDRADPFVYSEKDERWKANVIIDIYAAKEKAESERSRTRTKKDVYEIYAEIAKTRPPLGRQQFDLLYECASGMLMNDSTSTLDEKATKAVGYLLQEKETEENIFRFLTVLKTHASSFNTADVLNLSGLNRNRKEDIVAAYTKARETLGRNSYTVLDAMCIASLKERNDVPLENKVVYQNFVSGIRNEYAIKEPVLVIEPSLFFARRWLRRNPADRRKIVFALSDRQKRNLLELMFAGSGVSFVDTLDVDRLFIRKENHPTNILLFGNHILTRENKSSLLRSVMSLGPAPFRFCAFDTDDAFENDHSVYNDLYAVSLIDNVWLLPSGIANETVPARKMIINAVCGRVNGAAAETTVYKYSLSGNNHLSTRFLTIQIDQHDFAEHSFRLRSKFRKAFLDYETKTNQKRNKAVEFRFSEEISFFYTMSRNDGDYRLRAFIKDASSGRIVEESKVSARLDSEETAEKWLSETYPFSVHRSDADESVPVQAVITDNLKTLYCGFDMTLKSFIYFHTEQIKELPEIAFRAVKSIMYSELASFLISEIDSNMLSDQIRSLKLPFDVAANALDCVFDLAIAEGIIDSNPASLLLAHFEGGRNEDLSDIRSAMGRKFLYRDEIEKLVHLSDKKDDGHMDLATSIELYTALEPNIICALVWNDYKTVDVGNCSFSYLVVRRQLSNDGSSILDFKKRESFRVIPLPKRLSEKLDAERDRQLSEISKGNEEHLLSCTIICGKDRLINGQQMILSPSTLYRFNRKMIKKLKIEEDIIVVPDDRKGGIETNLAYYKGNIFMSNFRHWAVSRTELFTAEECAYLLGNKRPNTFATNYCDYGNPLSLRKLYLKSEKLWEELLDE